MGEANGLVSVVVPTFNRASMVSKAIESVLGQTYDRLELIVVDDGSTDDSDQLLARYAACDSRVRILRHAQNRGVTAAKNTGLDAARGEYAVVLDSDGDLDPEALRVMVDRLVELGPDYGMVFADLVAASTGARTGAGLDESREVTYRDAICATFTGDFIGLWRTDVTADLRFDERVPGGESLVWHQIYRRSRVAYIDRVLGSHDVDTPESVTKIQRGDTRKYSGRALIKQLYIEEFGDDLRRECPARLAHHYQGLALYSALTGHRVRSARAAFEAARTRPSPASIAKLAIPIVPRRLLESALAQRGEH